MKSLPPCGIYRTTAPIADVDEGLLVYFHNHGDPGPGIYLPDGWEGNFAIFAESGTTLEDPRDARYLEPLAEEGFYRVLKPFFCCEEKCREFEAELLVQLGYDEEATPIIFVPEVVAGVFGLPEERCRDPDPKMVRHLPLR
ncbi:MAG: hypothetical protein R3A47_10190 [Polyangiales bacterium]